MSELDKYDFQQYASRAFALTEALGETLSPIRKYLDAVSAERVGAYNNLSPNAITSLSRDNPAVFAKHFFWKNLTKCCLALTFVERASPPISKILDLGCGPGTFMFAVLALSPRTSVIGVDHNAQQLALAQSLAHLANVGSPALIRADITKDVYPTEGLFTASYLATELSSEGRDELVGLISRANESAFLIVDYINVVKELGSRISEDRKTYSRAISVELNSRLFTLVGDRRISFGLLYVPQASARQINPQLENPRYPRAV